MVLQSHEIETNENRSLRCNEYFDPYRRRVFLGFFWMRVKGPFVSRKMKAILTYMGVKMVNGGQDVQPSKASITYSSGLADSCPKLPPSCQQTSGIEMLACQKAV